MAAQASIYGRVTNDPRLNTTSKGTAMFAAHVAVDVTGYGLEEQQTWWVDIIAFGKLAESLQGVKKGDHLGAIGKVQCKPWIGPDGKERLSWSVLADAVMRARGVDRLRARG